MHLKDIWLEQIFSKHFKQNQASWGGGHLDLSYHLTGTFQFGRDIAAHNSADFRELYGYNSPKSNDHLGHNSGNYETFSVIPILSQKVLQNGTHNSAKSLKRYPSCREMSGNCENSTQSVTL